MTKAADAKNWTLHEWADGSNRSYPEPALPAWLLSANPSVGDWIQISSTALSGVTVSGAPSGRENIIDAWNGGCADQVNSVYWMLACGGHSDYGGNEVYKLDLSQDTPAWALARGVSSPLPQSDTHGSDGRPVSTHTYQQQVYSTHRSRAMRVGVGSMYSSAEDAYAVDGFNPATNDWDSAGTWPDITEDAPAGMQDFGCLIDDLTGDIYSTCIEDSSYTLKRLAFSNNTWSVVGSTLSNGRFATGAWDTTRNRGLLHTTGGNRFVSSGGAGHSSASFSGGSPGDYSGLIYCPTLDKYFWRTGASGGSVSQSTGDTLSTSSFTTSGGGSIPERENGCMNAFQYFQNLGGCLYVPSFTGNVWFLKLHDVSDD